jgi:putative hydrolase of the HAD superfamily
MIKAYIFDWGNTIMVDLKEQKGPMYKWNIVSELPHAVMTLKELSKKYRCYLSTNAENSNKNEIKKALERISIDSYFTDIFCFKEIGHKKPAPEYFYNIIQKTGFHADEIMMVGDDLENDIVGAMKAGMNGILFDPHNTCKNYQGKKIQDLFDLINDSSNC